MDNRLINIFVIDDGKINIILQLYIKPHNNKSCDTAHKNSPQFSVISLVRKLLTILMKFCIDMHILDNW